MWIDSHAHLNDKAFAADYQDVIAAALKNSVQAIIVVGFDLPSSEMAVDLASKEKLLWAAVGVSPHDAAEWTPAVARRIEILLQKPKVVALGEIGLDYYYQDLSKDAQLKAFKEQLGIARQYNKPVIIHNREAHQDTLRLLQDYVNKPGEEPLEYPGVMHCFSGSYEVALQCINLGFLISFAGPLTFTNANKLREVAVKLPLSKLLVETDSPYLSPHPHRGKRNEPARVGLVGATLAEIKAKSVVEVMETTSLNCKRLFKLNQ